MLSNDTYSMFNVTLNLIISIFDAISPHKKVQERRKGTDVDMNRMANRWIMRNRENLRIERSVSKSASRRKRKKKKAKMKKLKSKRKVNVQDNVIVWKLPENALGTDMDTPRTPNEVDDGDHEDRKESERERAERRKRKKDKKKKRKKKRKKDKDGQQDDLNNLSLYDTHSLFL